MMSRKQMEGGSHFCDTMFKGLSKQPIKCVVGERGSENLQTCVTSLMDEPLLVVLGQCWIPSSVPSCQIDQTFEEKCQHQNSTLHFCAIYQGKLPTRLATF